MVLSTEWAQVEVIDLINDGSGLAFGIIGGRSTGVVVKTILPGGVADRDGRLQSGDHILQIGDVNIRGLGSEQVASVLRQCGVHVRMVVARPVEPTSTDYQSLGSHAPIVPTKLLGDLDELDRHLVENGYAETFCHTPPDPYSTQYIYTRQQSDIELHRVSGIVDVVRNPLPIGTAPTVPSPSTPVVEVELLPLDMAVKGSPETETYSVDLKKDELGLGITVAGYICEKEEISGIFVKSISAGSAADLSKKILVNDRIIEVDGVSVIGFTNHQAVQKLRHTGPTVRLTCERYLRGPKYEQLQQAIRANELRIPSPPLSPSLSSLPKIPISLLDTSCGVEPEGESRTSIDIDSSVLLDPPTPVNEVEIVIDEKCSILHHQDSHSAIKDKWTEIIGHEAEIVVAELIKDLNGGLGISLEGTVDVEDGKEVRPHHYIRSVLPDGPVGRTGILQAGDELLEVNTIRLLGLNHVEVVAILRNLPQSVCLICARYGPDSSKRRIIDTSQDRIAFAARNLLAGSLQNLIPLNESLVKAKSESSLASCSTAASCHDSQLSTSQSKSRSLEMAVGLAMWSDEPEVVELNKGDKGLGFSILDYQDPLNPKETVIVIRSLVPGGVAHSNGRLIPGDRLLFVNDTSLAGASLDRAVQVLKGAPKGIVRIGVAKPLSSHDTLSQSSQMSSLSFQECVSDTEDHTCLEDYHECIEEYQECLEVMHICLDDGRRSYACSPCDSHENIKDDSSIINLTLDEKETVYGDGEVSQYAQSKTTTENNEILQNSIASVSVKQMSNLVDSIYNKQFSGLKQTVKCYTNNNKQSNFLQKVPDDSDKEGYETCQEDNFTEDVIKHKTITSSSQSLNEEHNFFENNINSCVSEPYIRKKVFSKRNHVYLETKVEEVDLKSYDDVNNSFGADQFFLVDYIDDDVSEDIPPEVPEKWISEPNVAEERTISRHFRKFLREYYNDYADCLEEYRKYSDVQNEPEINDNKVEHLDVKTDSDVTNSVQCNNNFLLVKSSSVPNSPEHLTSKGNEWDFFAQKTRRKSAYVLGYPDESDGVSMTVTRNIDAACLSPGDTAAMLEKHWGSTHTVQVDREPNTSLGISIVGGKVDLYKSGTASETLLGIFVKGVVPNSPAGRTGQFKTGDRILEVAGINLRQATHEKAVEAIRNASNPVTFLIQSIIPWANEAENEINAEIEKEEPISPSKPEKKDAEKILEKESEKIDVKEPEDVVNKSPETIIKPAVKIPEKQTENEIRKEPVEVLEKEVTVVVSEPQEKQDEKIDIPAEKPAEIDKDMERIPEEESEESEESEDEEDVRQLEGKTYTPKGHEIDRASAANIKRTREEIVADPETEDEFGYTNNKVKKKYASLGHSVLMVQLERGGQGLGLSLAGHRDRNCMAVFVCGLNPTGAAFRTGAIQVGDEILEVNGIVLHGRCHLNASAIIKGLSGPIFKVIILRRKTALDDIAVRPITQFPVSLEEETAEERYATYPNIRTVSIKKGSHSLGIMIIEGRHAEVGQGIFISDIQEGSSAEKAGLDIGEMILEVNKDSLLGASYDSAASLLKRTEGIVTLVVSNPNKKVPSRAPTPEITAATANDIKSEHTTPYKSPTPTPQKTPTALRTSAPPSRPTTPTAGEPIADPATCPIISGREITIEISTDNKSLGLQFVGGKDTLIGAGIVILEVFPDGAARKDGRLQAGDQLIDVNGTSLLDVTYTTACSAIRQILPKFKITVFRPHIIAMATVDVDLMKKPGKGLGLSIIAKKSGDGVYVSEILNGSTADMDGSIMKGDQISSVNEQSVGSLSADQVAALLKTAVGRVTIKLERHKPQIR